MKKLDQHWNKIFTTTDDTKLGWYEEDVSQTLKFFDLIEENEKSIIFIPGAGTSELVDRLLSNNRHLILNDISGQALKNLKLRIENKNSQFTIFHHDLSSPFPDSISKSDIWIDRAVLHFLLEENDINTYFDNLKNNLNHGGYVLFAEFSLIGSPKCAGLNLHRYSEKELNERLGSDFKLIKDEEYNYINPNGDSRPYIYALYKRC